MVAVNRINPEGGFLREFVEFRDRVQSLESKPAGNIAIRETLSTADPLSGVQTILGQLPDGSYGIQPFVGDTEPPPVASIPLVTAQPGSFVVSWDGRFVGDLPAPRDFVHVNVIGHKLVSGTITLTTTVGVLRLLTETVSVGTDVALAGETWQFSLESQDFNGNRAALSDKSAVQTMKALTEDSNISAALASVQNKADAAQTAASNAQTAASNAQTAADQAKTDAANAVGIANGKGKVLTQSAAPAVADQNANTLWIDTTGGANTPKRWDGTAWVAVTDKAATDAATAAAAAQTKADQAFANAASAATAAGNAQTSADSKNRIWYQTTAPTGTGHKVNDVWFDTTNNANKPYRWDGAAWVVAQDADIASAKTTANSALAAANGKNTNYYQTTVPTGGTYIKGDTWFDTSNGNKVYVYDGASFVSAQDSAIGAAQNTANSKTKTFIQSTAPTATTQGDIWIDTANGNVIKTWEGSAWVTRADAAIAAAQNTANNAQTAANGRNKIYYQTAQPSGGTYVTGDTWFDTDDGNRIYVYNGSTWSATDLGPSAIANLAITNAKIADGTIQSAKIGSVDAGTISVGTLSAARIGAGTIAADKLLVGDSEEFIPNPYFHPNGQAAIQGTILPASSTPVSAGAPYPYVLKLAARDNHPFEYANIPVKSGDQFYLEVWIATTTASRNFNLYMFGSTEPIGFLTAKDAVGNVAPTPTWTKVAWDYTVPQNANYAYIRPVLQIDTLGTETVDQLAWYVTGFSMRRKNTGKLIVDGAIQAGSAIIGTGAIGTAQIANAAIDTAQIKDAAIVNAKIANATIQAAKIGSVDAGTITVGQLIGGQIAAGAITTSHMTSGTIDAGVLTAGSITAPKIAGKSITADKLTISSTDNLLMGADFTGSSWQIGAYNSINSTAGRASMPAMRFTGTSAAITTINLVNRVAVGSEARFRGGMWIKSSATAPSGVFKIMGRCWTSSSVYTDIVIASNAAMASANTWTNVSGIAPVLPSGTLTMEFYLSVQNADNTIITDIDYVSVTRALDGKLVVDGAIDGKTITGATIQTAASGSRIVLDQTSLNAWNDTGDNYFNMSSATGVNISSLGQAGFDITRVNQCLNPSFEVDTTGWTAGSGQSFTRDSTKKYVGTYGLKVTNTVTADRIATYKIAVPVMNDYTASAYVFNDAATAKNMRIDLYYTDGAQNPVTGGTFTGAVVSVPPNTWTRLTVTDNGSGWPGTASNVRFDVVGVGFTATENMWVDAAMLEAVYNSTGPYFDGSTAESGKLSYVWEGTAGASKSDQRTARDVKIKTGGIDVLNTGIMTSKKAPGIGFIPPTPYVQTAGLFSDGQVISLIEGTSASQLTRIDVGNQQISTWSYLDTNIQARGRIYIGSSNGDVSLWGNAVTIKGTDMVTKHAEYINSGFTVSGGLAQWDIGPLSVDAAASSSNYASFSSPGPVGGSIKILESGYYHFACTSTPTAGPGSSTFRVILGSNTGRIVAQTSNTSSFWEMTVVTPVVYIAANDYIRFQIYQTNQTTTASRVACHKVTF